MTKIGIASVAALALAAHGASAAGHVRVSLAGRPAAVAVGRAWTAALTVRPGSFSGEVRVAARGPGALDVRATGGHGAYRARLVFPAAGRWTLTARAGGSLSPLGSIVVAAPTPAPLTLTWPTSIDLEPDGSLLVVENGAGRLERVQPTTGHLTVLASGLAKPFAAAEAPDGSIYLSDGGSLERIAGAAAPVTVATAGADIGPIAIAAGGDVFFTTATQLFDLAGGGAPRRIASGLNNPHGIAFAGSGALLVCDTDADRVLRIDPQTGATTTLIHVQRPRGIDIAGDGTIFIVEGAAGRVGRYDAGGNRLGDVGPVFGDPYDVEVGTDGTVYVLESAAQGTIRRVAPDGSVSAVPAGA